MYLIYKYTSPSGKSYIGQTNRPTARRREHQQLKNGCTAFYNAIQKYGWNNFTQETLAENISLEEANILEPKFIIEHNTLAPNGYNLKTGGLNQKHSNITKLKIKKARTGTFRSDITKQKIKKARAIQLPPSIESRIKISMSKKGKPAHNKGIPRSIETTLKISITKQNKTEKQKQKTSQKLSIARKGMNWKKDPKTGKRIYYFPMLITE